MEGGVRSSCYSSPKPAEVFAISEAWPGEQGSESLLSFFHSILFTISSISCVEGESGILGWVRRNQVLNHGVFLYFCFGNPINFFKS